MSRVAGILGILVAANAAGQSPAPSPATIKAWTDAGAEWHDDPATSRFSLAFDGRGSRFFDATRLQSLKNLPQPEVDFGLRVPSAKLPQWVPDVSAFRRLTRLIVHDPTWTKEELEAIAKLPPAVHIEAIISHVGDRTVFLNRTKPAIRALAELKVPWALNLRRLEIGDESLASLAPLPALQGLYLTEVHGNGSGLKAFPELRVLSVHNGGFSAEALPALAELRHLTHLEVSYAGADDALLKAVGKSATLSHLHLEKSYVTDKGLGELKSVKTLVWLDLRIGKPVSVESLRPLAALEHLNIVGQNFKNGELAKLADLKNLKRLIVGRGIENAEIDALKAVLPNCRIERD